MSSLVSTVTAAGVAEAHRGALLPARVDGIIREILVEENNAVAAGDLLLQIDTTEYALALARAVNQKDAIIAHGEMNSVEMVIMLDSVPGLMRGS